MRATLPRRNGVVCTAVPAVADGHFGVARLSKIGRTQQRRLNVRVSANRGKSLDRQSVRSRGRVVAHCFIRAARWSGTGCPPTSHLRSAPRSPLADLGGRAGQPVRAGGLVYLAATGKPVQVRNAATGAKVTPSIALSAVSSGAVAAGGRV